MIVSSDRPRRFAFHLLSTHPRRSSAKCIPIPCSCHLPRASATSCRAAAPSRRGQNGVCFDARPRGPLLPLFSRKSSADGVELRKSLRTTARHSWPHSTGCSSGTASLTYGSPLTIPVQMASLSDSTAPSAIPLSRLAMAISAGGRRSPHTFFGQTGSPLVSQLGTPPSTWHTASSLSYPSILPRPLSS